MLEKNRDGVIKILKYFTRCSFLLFIFKIPEEKRESMGKLLLLGCKGEARGVPKHVVNFLNRKTEQL